MALNLSLGLFFVLVGILVLFEIIPRNKLRWYKSEKEINQSLLPTIDSLSKFPWFLIIVGSIIIIIEIITDIILRFPIRYFRC